MIESLLADVRFSFRWLRRSPCFALVAALSLAIGIGFNTTLFAVADALLFKPLPVTSPERMVDVFTSAAAGPSDRFSTSSYPDYLDLKTENRVFDDVIGYSPMFAPINLDNRSRLGMGEIVTGNYFQALGVRAFAGRSLLPADDAPGAPLVAMVSYRYWQRELAAAPDAIGRAVRIRGNPFTIVGVAPAAFSGMVPMLSPELWIPVSASLDVEPVGLHDVVPSPVGTSRIDRRGDRWLFVRARLAPGKTIEQAQAGLDVVMSRLADANPATNKGRVVTLKATSTVHVHPAVDSLVLPVAAGLMVVVGLVLLVACANVASMLMARASARRKEIGIRLALGASRGRLLRQFVTEALVLSFIGAVAGVLFAWWATSLLASLNLPLPVPLALDLHIDLRVLLFTTGATLISGVLVGMAPALQAYKLNLTSDLRGEPIVSSTAGRRWTARDALVAGQMAVTALLLVVAALLTRALVSAQRVDTGFAVDRLALVSIDPTMVRYSDEQSRQFFDRALARLRALPGVESAALSTRVPFSPNLNRWDVWLPDRHQLGQPGDTVEVTTVSPGYFRTIGVPILSGRGFTDDDRPDSPRVAVVNEAMARRFWPGQNPIGKTFRTRAGSGPEFQIVGVSANYKVVSLGEAPTPFLHVARSQRPNSYTAVIARTRGDAGALLREMRRELLALEPNLVFIENQTMEAEMGATLFPVRAGAWLVSAFGLTAMLLAAIGLYGVIAYSVARRTREIGVRMALGARPASVVADVMRHGLVLAAVGLTVGFALAAVAVRAIASALYGVSAADPLAWLSAALVVIGVSAVANLVPAWRAAHVDPSVALRTE